MKSHGDSPRFGIKQRTFQRKQRKDAIHRKVDDLLIQYLPHLKHNHSDPDSYEEQIQKFSQELEKLYPKFEDYREGRNHLSRQINKGNIDERWSLPVPEYLIRIKRPRPFRTEAWFKQVRTLNRWKTAWYHHLNSRTVTAEPAGEEPGVDRPGLGTLAHPFERRRCANHRLLGEASFVGMVVVGGIERLDLELDRSEGHQHQANLSPVSA